MDESAPDAVTDTSLPSLRCARVLEESGSGADGTLKALEEEYARLHADLKALQYEIGQIHGLRISELAKTIRKRRYRLLQLEEQIFRKRQLNLFPNSPILRPKRERALENSGREALLEGRRKATDG